MVENKYEIVDSVEKLALTIKKVKEAQCYVQENWYETGYIFCDFKRKIQRGKKR